ncbi:DUF4296 domain-containing protein [Psychroserpens sp. XS_ASV72]|uniref:DUF4296 domain-containing protein n=1 Tax=Psychroserpens sp. XS_ASV72 TaxID=3241293 RepID=UPI0035192F57
MIRLVIIVCCISILVSCDQVERPKKPDNLISKGKMVDILYDMFVLNAAKATDRRLLEKNKVTPDRYIYEKHQIDSMQFVKSNEYYAYDIKVYEDIINQVEAKIQNKKQALEKAIEKEEDRRKNRLDSIRKLGDTIIKNKPYKKELKTRNEENPY